MAYKNRNGVAISNAEAMLEQWSGRAVMDSVSGASAVTDVSGKVKTSGAATKDVRDKLTSGRTE